MKIDVSYYGSDARGCLLRFRNGAWWTGYADLHPWTAFGDPGLEEQIDLLAKGQPSRVMKKTMSFAMEDAAGRRRRGNCLRGLQLPETHILLAIGDHDGVERARRAGFRYFKFKMGKDLNAETDFLRRLPEGWLRLDFNGQLNHSQFSAWWEQLDATLRARIQVIEDAYVGAGLAPKPEIFYADWLENPSWRGRVFKPARDQILNGTHCNHSVLFTHSLDHPLGQVAAIWEASRFYRRHPHLRQPGGFSAVGGFDDFDRVWNRRGPGLKPVSGTGFGFDELLAALSWQQVL